MMTIFERYDVSTKKEIMQTITEVLLNLPWYENIGMQNKQTEATLSSLISEITLEEYDIKWIDKKDLNKQLDKMDFSDSEIWQKLKDLPSDYKKELEELKLTKIWDIMLLELPEHLFHVTFKKAYELFEENKENVKYLINNAYYISVLITLSYLTNDKLFANKLIDLVKTGNTVVGFKGDTILLL